MSADHLIDVLMPVQNAQSTILSAVASIQRQTVTGRRLIAIDDGSNDEKYVILSKLMREDRRIMVLRGPQQGVPAQSALASSLPFEIGGTAGC